MILSFSDLKNLSVFSQSGINLGQIIDLEIDSESQSVIRYVVRRGRLVSRFQKSLLIHRQQVISISQEKMVVEDAVAKEVIESEEKKNIAPQVAPSGVSARQL